MMVFFGEAEEVRAGFALALDVMESNADLLIAIPAHLKN
jgi:hypothetical protein